MKVPVLKLAALSATSLLLAGCGHAPVYNIVGSFFPVWIFCGIAGIGASFLVHVVMVRFQLEYQLSPPLIVYPAIAMLITLGLWLVFFS